MLDQRFINDIINDLCEPGWEKPDTKEVIEKAVKVCAAAGMTQPLIEEVLGGLINAIRNEYGD